MPNKKMHIFIDESGDTGIKFDKGSSGFFVVSLLCIENYDLPKGETFLKKAKDYLNIKQKELRFSQISFDKKILFYKTIKNMNFFAHIFIYRKKAPENFSWFIIKALTYLEYKDTGSIKIIVDGLDKNKLTDDDIRAIRHIFKGIKVRVLFADSKKSILLQMSDMLAGLAHSIHKGKSDYENSLKVIKNKVKITRFE